MTGPATALLNLLPSGGPIFALRWSGRVCPCLEKDEDRNARQALQSLGNLNVLWKTGGSSSSGHGGLTGGGTGTGFLSSLFSSSTGSAGAASAAAAPAVPARLVVRDDEHGEPEFFVDPVLAVGTDDAATTSGSPDEPPKTGATAAAAAPASVGYKLQVRVRRVDRVTLEGNDVVLLARKVDDSKAPPKQLLRFELPPSDSTTEKRNLTVHHLSVLVEWERQRRVAMGYHDGNGNYNEEEEEDQPNFLAARAQKAAHFARRELELQQTRREREKRKAKLVQESGGLKYTALAMASRGESA